MVIPLLVQLDMMGSFMQERLAELGRKVPTDGLPTVLNAWNGEKLLLFTPLLRWYLQLGIVMTEVHDVIQYQPNRCFKTFIDSCVKGRINATAAGKPTEAQSFKICVNSRYIFYKCSYFNQLGST